MLPHSFFARPTLLVARELIGKLLVRQTPEGIVNGMIVEVESYIDIQDKASHAFGGKKTLRTSPMFDDAGTIYVYLIYGQNYCLNLVTEEKDKPCAILIRAVEPFSGLEIMTERRNQKKPDLYNLCSGPGKVCSSFAIDKSLNSQKLAENTLAIYDFMAFSDDQICVTPRINVNYAASCKNLPYRFYLKGNRFISAENHYPNPITFSDLIAKHTQTLTAKKI